MTSPNGRIHQSRSLLDGLYRLIDAACIVAGLWIGLYWSGRQLSETLLLAACATTIVYYLVAEMSGLYRGWRGVSADRELVCVLTTWAPTLAAVLLGSFLLGQSGLWPRRLVLSWLVCTPTAIASSRIVIRMLQRMLRARGFNARRFAVVGVTDLGLQLARNIEDSPHLGLKLTGFFDDRPAARTPDMPGDVGRRIGSLDDLVQQARQGQVDMIYITFPMRAERRIKDVLERLGDSTCSVYVVPDFFVFELLHSRWTNIGGLPAVSVFENPFYGVDGIIKRLVDLVLASLILLAAAIPMALIALAIKLTSPGPVFFRQKRYGLDGREIKVWKFRSMTVCEDGAQVAQATRSDPRVTPLGALLRKTSLDELPQLFNVLEGSMSLVGPRPHATAHNEGFRTMIQGYMLRHKVKPGITGLAQVNGWRGETDTLYKMQKRIEYDHKYIREWSPWLDFKILAQTITTVLSHKNAY